MNLNLILVILFYFSIILIVYFNKDKFQIYGKIIALYRTHLGIQWMEWIARKIPRTIKFFSFIGIFIGFLGMGYISYILIEGAINLTINPNAPAVIAPVIPGIRIPGSPLFVPFWYGIISIFIVAVIHEFSHGVVASAYKIKVKNSGIVFFGPIIGAFVEPDEKILRKSSYKAQVSVFSAGPFSNIILGVLLLLLLGYVIIPMTQNLIEFDGILIQNVEKGMPADIAGIRSGSIIRYINNVEIKTSDNFSQLLLKYYPDDKVLLSDGTNKFEVILGKNPTNESLPLLGILHTQNSRLKDQILKKYGNYLPQGLFYFKEFLVWLFILSVGIGLANLLPLGPVDGGRIFQISLLKTLDTNKFLTVWKFVNSIIILLLLFNLFYPYIRYIF